MSVNFVKLSTPKAKGNMEKLISMIKEKACSATEISDTLGITKRRVNEYIKRLRDDNEAHIHKYELVFTGRHEYPVAFYIYGYGTDAVYIPKPKATSTKEWRTKVNADPKKKAIQKAKRRAYEHKIKTNPKFRTIYENKLWRNRHRTPRCDIAASWIK